MRFVDLLLESFHRFLSLSFEKSKCMSNLTAIKQLNITNSDMNPSYHSVSSEPFYYEQHNIPDVKNAEWFVTNEIIQGKKKTMYIVGTIAGNIMLPSPASQLI